MACGVRVDRAQAPGHARIRKPTYSTDNLDEEVGASRGPTAGAIAHAQEEDETADINDEPVEAAEVADEKDDANSDDEYGREETMHTFI